VRSVDPDAPPSVHMASWPAVDDAVIDDTLAAQVALVRRVVELGRAARAASSVRTRQPLARALVSAPGWSSLPAELVAEVASELNVLDMASLSASEGDLVDVTAKANFRSLGKRYGKQVQDIAAAIAATDAAALASGLRSGAAQVSVDGIGVVDLTEEDVVITETPREGWSVASGEGETVALDLELTDDLRRLGIAREAVRLIQEARKSAGLEISDRIALRWQASDPMVTAAMREHEGLISGEVLATAYAEGEPEAGDHIGADPELGLAFGLHRA
jgi:isoleucyl-tRNA synthetase